MDFKTDFMKKILFALLVSVIMGSCKKETIVDYNATSIVEKDSLNGDSIKFWSNESISYKNPSHEVIVLNLNFKYAVPGREITIISPIANIFSFIPTGNGKPVFTSEPHPIKSTDTQLTMKLKYLGYIDSTYQYSLDIFSY